MASHGTLVKAWASMKSFQPRAEGSPPDEPGGGPDEPLSAHPEDASEPPKPENPPMTRRAPRPRNAEVDFRGEKRSNMTHASTTDPDARLFKKSPGAGAMLCFMGHTLMENRIGLVVQADLTQADGPIQSYARDIRDKSSGDTLDVLHTLLDELQNEITYDTDPTHASTTAIEAFSIKRGVCQDLTHIFIAAARHLGIPARYIGGYMHRADGVVNQTAGHAWAEAYIDDFGWVAFDPANGICPTDAHVRVAVGLDYLGAAPVRGTRYGGDTETLEIAVKVQAMQQSQN